MLSGFQKSEQIVLLALLAILKSGNAWSKGI
jgi:hypothetical protein